MTAHNKLIVGLVLGLLLSGAALAKDEFWLGAGINSDESYQGSVASKSALVPLWDFTRAVDGSQRSIYFGRVSRGYPEVGVQTKLSSVVSAGVQVGFEPGRKLVDFSDRAKQMGIPAFGDGLGLGFHLEASGNWGPAPMAAVIRFRQRTPAQQGMLLDVRYDVGVYQNGALGVGLNAQAIWANANAMQTDFGVTAAQAASIGASAFDGKNGWQSTALGLAAQYDISPTLQWLAAAKRKKLNGGLASSAIAERMTSTGVTTGLMWKF